MIRDVLLHAHAPAPAADANGQRQREQSNQPITSPTLRPFTPRTFASSNK
jgi:hypothetical protein